MYTNINFKTKKQLKEAVARGDKVTIYQPNADLTGARDSQDTTNYEGKVFFVEGPHYPEPHRWYAEVILKDGVVVKVR